MPPAPAPKNPIGLAGLNLADLARSGSHETGMRLKGAEGLHTAALSSMFNESQGRRKGELDEQTREQQFRRAQMLADETLARREAAVREQAAMGRYRSERQQQQMVQRFDDIERRRETANWFDQQTFQTDEAIRQAEAIAAIQAQYEGQEGSGIPALRSFGTHAIHPLRGAALNAEQPGRFEVSDKDRQAAAAAIARATAEQIPLEPLLREHFGKRDRTASLALWQLGYGLE
jgi:hypothetical protein